MGHRGRQEQERSEAEMATLAWALHAVRALTCGRWRGAVAWAARTRQEQQGLDAVYTVWREAIEQVAVERGDAD